MTSGLKQSVAREELSFILETPQKKTPVVLLGGLLPEFQMLFRRKATALQSEDENEIQSQLLSPKLQNVSRSLFDTSRLALSTIQTYGKQAAEIIPKTISTSSFPTVVQNKSKRVHKQSPSRSHKKTKYAKINSGVRHGIRKPKQRPKTGFNHDNYIKKIHLAKKLRIKAENTQPKDAELTLNPAESFSTDDSWVDSMRDEVTIIVDNLNSDIEKEIVIDEDPVISTDEQLDKISELMRVMQDDDNASPVKTKSCDMDHERIQEVEDLLDMLLGEPPKEQIIEESFIDTTILEVSGLNESMLSDSLQSPCVALSKPSKLESEKLLNLQELVKRLENSAYNDPDDTDPFAESDDEECFSDETFSFNTEDYSSDMQSNSEKRDPQDSKINVESENNLSTTSSDVINVEMRSNNVKADELSNTSTYGEDSSPPSIILGENILCKRTDYNNVEQNQELSSDNFSSAMNSSQSKIKNRKENENQDSPPSKLFSIFLRGNTPGRDKESCPSPILSAPRSSPFNSPRPKASPQRAHNLPIQEKDGKEQMLLDAGQKKFGIVTCDECCFLYDPDVRADVEAHLAHHNRHQTLLRHKGWKNENIIAEYEDGGRILLIQAGDPLSWWRRVSTILEVVNYDLGFIEDIVKYSQIKHKVFLYIWKNYIAGCIVAEQIFVANRMLPGTEAMCSEETFDATCGITRVWTSSVFRCQGIASRLVKAVQENFLSHRDLKMEEIAFSSPTPDGRAFATKLLNTPTFLVY